MLGKINLLLFIIKQTVYEILLCDLFVDYILLTRFHVHRANHGPYRKPARGETRACQTESDPEAEYHNVSKILL